MKSEYELSVVIPCLNEEDTLKICLDKIKKVYLDNHLNGEIIVVDNGSTDKTAYIAQQNGAKLITENIKGYGAALRRGIKEAKGKYILMGDADDSYDFLDIMKFLNKIKEGYDLVQGCRLASGGGTIEKGAMPFSHEKFGNPLFSFLVRFLYKAPYHDVYCGMRIFKKDTINKITHFSKGMEFAIENLIKFNANNLKISQVPIKLYKDGRINSTSHLRTISDGLRTFKLLLICCPKWLYFFPSIFFLTLGLHNVLNIYFSDLHDFAIFKEITISGIFFILSLQIFLCGIFASLKAEQLGFEKSNQFIKSFFKFFKLNQLIIAFTIIFIFSIIKIKTGLFVIYNNEIDLLISYFIFYFSVTLLLNSLLVSFLEFEKE